FQLSEYQRIFEIYWNHPSVIGITLWGYRTGMWRTNQAAFLIETCLGLERPALADYLNTTVRASNPIIGTFIDIKCTDVISNVEAFDNDRISLFTRFFPNPLGVENAALDIISSFNGNISVKIFEQSGKLIHDSNYYVSEGINSISIHNQYFNIGLNIVQIISPFGVETRKVIK
ncbi:MAG TPA: T9SS type A sorting domain-containing protein, partial [Saprospiraceae bacterium]|nr:T9SS type A sorting domain-containing protein [Saprospiraceae bacterium]